MSNNSRKRYNNNSQRKNDRNNRTRSKPLAQMSEEELVQEAINRSLLSNNITSSKSKSNASHHHQKQQQQQQQQRHRYPKPASTSSLPPKHTPTPLDGRYVLRPNSFSHNFAKLPNCSNFIDIRKINWEDVTEFISYEQGTTSSCPICQEPPLAARVGECAHRICLPCYLRVEQQLNKTNKHVSKCSICNKDLSRSVLKRSTIADTNNRTKLKVGSVVTFQLISQSLQQTEILPVPFSLHNSCSISSSDRQASMIAKDAAELEQYLMLAQQDAIELKKCGKVDMANKELKDAVNLVQWSFTILAEEAERELNGISDNVFAQSVLNAIRRTMSIYNDVGKIVKGNVPLRRWESSSSPAASIPPSWADSVLPVPSTSTSISIPTSIKTLTTLNNPNPSISLQNENKLWVLDVAKSDSIIKPQPTKSLTVSTSKTVDKPQYYYYQLSTGEYCFLHPLMVRILKDEYGDYINFPKTIQVKIIQIDQDVLHVNNYSRYKYLRCIPLGATISLCEIQLQHMSNNSTPLVSKEVLKRYKTDLLQRSKIRNQKIRRDDNFSRNAARKTEESYKNFVFTNNGGGSPLLHPISSPELTSQESFPTMGGGSSGDDTLETSSTLLSGAWGAKSVSSDVKQFSTNQHRSMIKSQAVLRSRSDPKWAELASQDVAFNKDGQATVKSQPRLNLHSILSSNEANGTSTKIETEKKVAKNDDDDGDDPFASMNSKKKKKKKKKKKGVMLFNNNGGRSR